MKRPTSEPIRVFLIDDHRSVLWGLRKLIESAAPAMVLAGEATSWKDALNSMRQEAVDVILLDLDLGDEAGLDAIPHFVSAKLGRVLVLTGIRDIDKHDQAVVLGARGVVEKENPAETILDAIVKVHEGQLWLPRTAIDRILADLSKRDNSPKPTPEQGMIKSLTPREREIVAAVATNAKANSRLIAEQLFISEHTLRNHLTSIYLKLGVISRLELFAFAHQHGLTGKERR